MKSPLAMQLTAVAVFALLVVLQAAAFRLLGHTWADALAAWRGLWFVHFILAFAGVARLAKERE
jgi:hypothetical protein